jgi:hypothetical protein
MKYILSTFIAATLSGCASVSPKITQIDDRVFQVSTTVHSGYRINLDDSPEGIARVTLKAAANKSIELGCPYFSAINNDTQSFKITSAQTSEEFTRSGDGTVIYKSEEGQIFRIIKPSQRGNTYLCFRAKPNALLPGLIFNSKYVAESIN